MLNSLEIKNYRNLKHLRIEKLGRVNLIVGKNNTGKSSLLEAVSIYTAHDFGKNLFGILDCRFENQTKYEKSDDVLNTNLRSIASLFYNRKLDFFSENRGVTIGESSQKYITFRLQKTYYERGVPSHIQNNLVVAQNENEVEGKDVRVSIAYNKENGSKGEVSLFYRSESTFSSSIEENFQIIRAKEFDKDINSTLWGKIALTQKEEFVVDALRIINPLADRITFIGSDASLRPIIKLNNGTIESVRSMGDGINRILTIILAMVNCENGYLLIDEFENGLHYSVQEKLWEIIFHLAERLSVQVFATTHSSDAIRTFENIANSRPEYKDAQLIKLRNIDGEIEVVLFDAEDLEVMNDNPYIDPR